MQDSATILPRSDCRKPYHNNTPLRSEIPIALVNHFHIERDLHVNYHLDPIYLIHLVTPCMKIHMQSQRGKIKIQFHYMSGNADKGLAHCPSAVPMVQIQ